MATVTPEYDGHWRRMDLERIQEWVRRQFSEEKEKTEVEEELE